MPLAPRPTSFSGTSEQSLQSAVPAAAGAPEPLPAGVGSSDPSGANVGTVQPATARTITNRNPATRRRRRGTITAFPRQRLLGRGYPVGPTTMLSGWSAHRQG